MKRILFVDDQPNILGGLQRMLHGQRKVWNMSFVESGEEALAAMEEAPFDVVVTDMKMPIMSGAQLLKQVHERYPKTVRIVLSGYADLEAAMQSVAVSHQFLAKPCDSDTLKSVVNRACGLAELLNEETLKETLGAISELPVLPRTYQALRQALAEEEVDIGQVGAIVEQDAGIAAKILQLVNSSFFGIRKEITDLRQATAYLGISTIRDLTLSFEMFRGFEGCTKLAGFSVEREQRHSLLTARIASKMFDDKVLSGQAFLSGMLHDIGKLILATRFEEPFQAILLEGAGVTSPFQPIEEKLLGVGHGEIGAYLLGLWGMSYPVVEAVAHHHNPSRVPEQTMFGALGATHVADCLALELEGRPGKTIALDEEYLASLGVLDRLPEWREMAAHEAGADSEAA